MRMIDGDQAKPTQIAHRLGYIGDALTEVQVQEAVDLVFTQNDAIVTKILKTGKTGPISALVGKVMQQLNKRGDPKQIQQLVNDKLT